LLCDPGDAVLVPRPSYPLFSYLARLESVDVHPYALSYDGQWHLGVDAVREALVARTRAVVVVSPNNPTGSYLKRTEAAALLALCAESGLAVVSDEVFADYAFAPDARRVASLATDGPALAFSLGGLSKSCGLPQVKLAWIAVSGPERWRAPAIERLEVVADTYLSVSTPAQRAAGALLARRPELQRPIAERVDANRDALRRRLGPAAPATLLDAEGGWSAVLQVPATRSEDDLVSRLLEEHGVLVHPGYFFDFPREAFLVLSLLPPPATFADAVDRILAVL
ncbi:MAG TPA: pyridoxal phosphate-dependent aminotransferase, partial [Solirubrobacteraceae bacterium]